MNQPAAQIAPDQLPAGSAPPVEMSDEDIFAQEVDRRTGVVTDDDPAPAAPAAEPPVEEPPAQQVAEEPPAPLPEGSEAEPAAPAEAKAPKWYTKLSDEAKEAYDANTNSLAQLQEQYTSIHGRLAPVQQENARLRDRLAEVGRQMQAAPPAAAPAPGQPATPPTAAAPTLTPEQALDLASVPEFAEFKEAFPDEAKAIEAIFGRQAQHINHLGSQLGDVSQGLRQIQTDSFSQSRSAALKTLSDAHPDWMQLRPSEDFAQWCAAQPASVARMADSPDPNECIYVLDRYKQDVYLQRQLNQPDQPGQSAPQNTQGTPSTAQAVRLRRQQIRSNVSLDPQASDVGVPQGNPQEFMTDEEIWDQEVERRLRLQRDSQR